MDKIINSEYIMQSTPPLNTMVNPVVGLILPLHKSRERLELERDPLYLVSPIYYESGLFNV